MKNSKTLKKKTPKKLWNSRHIKSFSLHLAKYEIHVEWERTNPTITKKKRTITINIVQWSSSWRRNHTEKKILRMFIFPLIFFFLELRFFLRLYIVSINVSKCVFSFLHCYTLFTVLSSESWCCLLAYSFLYMCVVREREDWYLTMWLCVYNNVYSPTKNEKKKCWNSLLFRDLLALRAMSVREKLKNSRNLNSCSFLWI